MHEIINNTPYEEYLSGRGPNACLDDLVWFNENRGPGSKQENIKNSLNRILGQLGVADCGEGTAQGSHINQNAVHLIRTIHPQSIKSLEDFSFLNYEIMQRPNSFIGTMPEKAKCIWGVLSYIEGFTYLIPSGLGGSRDGLGESKVFFENSLLFYPSDKYINEVLSKIVAIENALTRHSSKRKGLLG